MKHYIIVEQNVDDVAIVESSGMPSHLQNASLFSVFPSGSDWAHFTYARSFRFLPLDKDYYLLSYTYILGDDQDLWNGTLRAWGIIDKPEAFLSKSLLQTKDPREIFIQYKNKFRSDPYFSAMVQGLNPPFKPQETTTIPWWMWLLVQTRFRLPFQLKFKGREEWTAVESISYRAFCATLWQTRVQTMLGRQLRPTTFTTFTLAPYENANIIGIPVS